MIQVAAAIIRNDQGGILLCRRGPGGECAGLWEFPGGKIEPGETAYDCVVREIREELGVRILPKGVMMQTQYAYPSRTIDFTFFDAKVLSGTIMPQVHAQIAWVSPAGILQYDICPADRSMARRVAERGEFAVLYAHSAQGKPWQTLEEHLQHTAQLAAEFAGVFGCTQWGSALGWLHDIGKAKLAFQRKLEGKAIRVEHSAAGAVLADEAKGVVRQLAYCVAGHHGGLPDGGAATDMADATTLRARLKREREQKREWEGVVNPQAVLPKAPPAITPFCVHPGFSLSFWMRMLFSCLVDADYLDTEAFVQGPQPRGGGEAIDRLRERLDEYMGRFGAPTTAINIKRCEILEDCRRAAEGKRGLYALTVPTGGGKTLASLAFALRHAQKHELRRVIYVIPYTSIIEQTAQEFRRVLGAQNVLEHTSTAEYDGEDTDEAAYARRLAAENWDAPVVVTTSVQFFESLMANKPSRCRKLHNISESVVIFDEAQQLPERFLLPVMRMIAELVQSYGVTAVLCTATQPSLGKFFKPLGFEIKEICGDTLGLYHFFRRVRYEYAGRWTDARIAEELRAHDRILVVVNSIAHAQALYESIGPEDAYCLTTLLTPAERRAQIGEIKAKLLDPDAPPCRVISTSLIEAGVDLDFPRVCREVAGLDSIIQAAGRCNREGKRGAEESMVTVFRTDAEWEGRVPTPLKTPARIGQRIMETHEDIASPDAIAAYFDTLHVLRGEALDAEHIVEEMSKPGSIPFAWADRTFKLIGEDTCAVLIPRGVRALDCEERLRAGERSRELLRAAAQYCVNIRKKALAALLGAGAIEILDDQIAVLISPEGYDPHKGLHIPATGIGLFS